MSILSGGGIAIRNCVFAPCGKAFQKSRNKRYCNPKCAQADYMRTLRKNNAPVYEERTCKMCSDPFIPKRKDQNFCCGDCGHLFFNVERVNKTTKQTKHCVKCNKEFVAFGLHNAYCTTECRIASLGPVILPKRKCRHCKKNFQPRSKHNRYCKRQCFRNYYGRGLPLPEKLHCLFCNAIYQPKRLNNRFCNGLCAHNYHNAHRPKKQPIVQEVAA